MPTLVWLYLTALLYYRTSATCVVLAEALQTVSHDRLTRMLQADWSGQRLLESACRTLFVWERGELIIDDTVVPKPFATVMEGLGLLQPRAQAGVWLLLGPADLDGWELTNSAGRTAVAQGRPLKVCVGLRVGQLRAQSAALSPGVCAVRRLVSLQGLAEAHSGLWMVLCVSPQEEPPVQWPAPPGLSAPSVLGGDWVAEWWAQGLGRQIRRQVLRDESPDTAGRRGSPTLSGARKSRRSSECARINSG
jgi:hypothetical protein